jgi:PAS domain S-box-containing protein
MNRNLSFLGGISVGAGFSLSRAILALAPVLVTFLVQLMMWPIIRPFAWFLFSPAVFLSAWIGGRKLGSLAAVVATALIWYFFLQPERSFVERDVREVVAALTFLGTGVIFSLFHDRLKQANQRVAEALVAKRYQAQLESVFQAIQDGIVVADMEGHVLLVNEAEARLFGFPSAEAMKRDIAFYQDLYEFSYPDGKPLPFEEWPINKLLKGESIRDYELRARRRDVGQERFLSCNGEPVRDQQGKQILAVVGTRDITEQKLAEESLRASESRFRAIFENAAVGIARVAPDGRFLEVNQRLCDIVGYTREVLLTKTFGDITHPDDLEADWDQAQRLLAGEIEHFSMEKRYYRKDGSIIWINLTESLVRKADGSPDYLIKVVEDITARKQAEEKLRDSEERLRLASNAARLGVFEWNVPADRAVWENDRMYEIFGHTRADGTLSRAQLVENYVHPDDVASLGQALADGMKSGRPVHTIYRIRRKDGALRWLDLSSNFELARDGAPIRMIGVLADITERILAEDALRDREQRYELVLAGAGAAIWDWDVLAKRVVFSPLWKQMRGFDDGEVSDREEEWTSGIHPEDRERVLAAVKAHFEGRTPVFAEEYRVRHKSGRWIWILDRGLALRDPAGRVIRMAGSETDITEQKKSEEALRASEERFRIMADTAPVLIWISGTDKLCTFFNKPWLDFTGRTMEEELGNGWTEGVHPEDYDRCLEIYVTSFEAREPFEMEYRLRRYDGEHRWIVDRGVPRFSPSGDFLGYIGSCLDITERKEIEEALRASELRFRTMISAVPTPTYETDQDGNNIFVSDQWLAYAGMTAEESAGAGFIRAYHPDEAEDVMAQWSAAVRSGISFESKCRIRATDGSYRWFLNRAMPGRDAEGRIVRWAGSLTDIDDLIRAEEALRESKERLAGIVSSAMDAIITIDEDQRVVLFNEAAERMFGCPAAEALGQLINRFIPERFRGAHTEYVRRYGETGGASRAMGRISTLTALRADGAEFPIEAAISTIEVGGRKLYTVIHRDITERKQAEAEREELAREQVARAAAEAANRSKDEFLTLVSHELRSPLNAIFGFSRLLRSGPAGREEINKATDVIERSVKAQLQIIEDLLDSARIISGKLRIEPELIDLVPALESALDTVRAAAEAKGVTLVADFGPLPVQALGDPMRLQQVVWNLLTNAVKFTPGGGRVELRMESDADNVRITVSDTGKGIEPGFLPFVFDRFRQADPSSARRVGGLGLGLSLVKNLVELHGGTITAASEGVGRGATFTITLPHRQPEFIAPPTPAIVIGEVRTEGAIALDESLSLEGVSVLVVDDQEEARAVLTQTLGDYGAQVTAAPSGAEALALLSNPPGGRRPDALILDIAMPGEDGYTVLKKVRALETEQGRAAESIPAIALTAYGRSEDRLRALQAGFQMHVAKPVEPAELAIVIASLTSKRRNG